MISVSASVNLPCTIKSRSSVLAPAHLGGSGKGAIKRLWWCLVTLIITLNCLLLLYEEMMLQSPVVDEERLKPVVDFPWLGSVL